MTTQQHPTGSASLYVGDLNPEVTETVLFKIFNTVGTISSIRVCRDSLTRRSLGYAYVNFLQPDQAERAIELLNNTEIEGRPCRIMWSQRDPSIRKSGVGNVFIKNLDTFIGPQELHDTFSAFGSILSCKVATNPDGTSKGYGYVHYQRAQDAEEAIMNVNGMTIGNSQVVVEKFIPRKERMKLKEKSWTNVYIKDLDPSVTRADLERVFSDYGAITSSIVMQDKNENSRGFGFVNFASHDSAVQAVENLNGRDLAGKPIYCARAQKRAERDQILRKEFEQRKRERLNKYQGVNLYIKNIEDHIDEERLRKEFEPFGTIESIKIMTDERGESRGFGFVCYSTPEEAQLAIARMNRDRILPGCTKPLFVALHEPKEIRAQKLAARHAARAKSLRPQGAPAGMPPYAQPPGQQPGHMFYPTQGYYFNQNPPMMPPPGPHSAAAPRARWGPHSPPPQVQPVPSYVIPQPGPHGEAPPQPEQPYREAETQPEEPQPTPAPQPEKPESAVPAPSDAASSLIERLKNLPHDTQRRMLGEILYKRILPLAGQLTGKITGMLISSKFSNDELTEYAVDDAKLEGKVNDAIKALSETGQEEAQQERQDTEGNASAESQ